MSAEKIVYEARSALARNLNYIAKKDAPGSLTWDEAEAAAKKLNEHARLVEMLREAAQKHRSQVFWRAIDAGLGEEAADEATEDDVFLAKLKALLAEVEKEKTP